MAEFKENAIEFLTGEDTATVTFSQKRYITKVLKLAEKDPKVEIIEMPETNEGYLVAHIPLYAVKISAKRQVSDAQRESARARLLKRKSE